MKGSSPIQNSSGAAVYIYIYIWHGVGLACRVVKRALSVVCAPRPAERFITGTPLSRAERQKCVVFATHGGSQRGDRYQSRVHYSKWMPSGSLARAPTCSALRFLPPLSSLLNPQSSSSSSFSSSASSTSPFHRVTRAILSPLMSAIFCGFGCQLLPSSSSSSSALIYESEA